MAFELSLRLRVQGLALRQKARSSTVLSHLPTDAKARNHQKPQEQLQLVSCKEGDPTYSVFISYILGGPSPCNSDYSDLQGIIRLMLGSSYIPIVPLSQGGGPPTFCFRMCPYVRYHECFVTSVPELDVQFFTSARCYTTVLYFSRGP